MFLLKTFKKKTKIEKDLAILKNSFNILQEECEIQQENINKSRKMQQLLFYLTEEIKVLEEKQQKLQQEYFDEFPNDNTAKEFPKENYEKNAFIICFLIILIKNFLFQSLYENYSEEEQEKLMSEFQSNKYKSLETIIIGKILSKKLKNFP